MANLNFPAQNSQKTAAIWDDDIALSEEGGYFVATNPTVGTGITGTVCVDDAATGSSTHAQYAPFVLLYNTQSAANPNAYSIYPRYFKFMILTAPASASVWRYSMRMDPVNRWSSGGTLITPVQPNPNSSRSSIAQLNVGALVPTALPSASARLVASGYLDSAIPVISDQYLIKFGNAAANIDLLNGGSTAKNVTNIAPPIIIPPGWGLAFDWWGTSNSGTAIVAEFELAWAERIPGL
jgi:hypothetical protein